MPAKTLVDVFGKPGGEDDELDARVGPWVGLVEGRAAQEAKVLVVEELRNKCTCNKDARF